MLASYHDHPSIVTMLLSKRADPNVLNARGQAPVAGAVFKGHKEVVELLVRGGADVSLGQPNALDTARMFKREDLLEILRTGKGAENERAEGDRPWEGERASADLGEMRNGGGAAE
jgi:ankyrin repeat protein